MKKILQRGRMLVICGPTATGKTSLGLFLSDKFNGEIISADSRQVFKKMDIGTGKDLPKNSKLQISDNKLSYYVLNGVRIYGYDLVDASSEFSIAEYLKFVKKAIREVYSRKKLPVIVGGTGFYIKGIMDGIPTAEVPRNNNLRIHLTGKSVAELYESLSQIDPVKAASFNSSDRKNPRRLTRALEVAEYVLDHPMPPHRLNENSNKNSLTIGLYAPREILNKRIDNRVEERLKSGFVSELRKLLKSGISWHHQSMFSLGYRQFRDYIEGEVDEDVVTEEWKREEKKYAQRQMVWFKKDIRIKWFDISDPAYRKNVENLVSKWYYSPEVN